MSDLYLISQKSNVCSICLNLVGVPNLTVVHFWAPWATQCEPMDEAMKILAEEEPDLKSVNFLRVEAEQLADVSMDYEVSANAKLLHIVEFMEIYSYALF